MAIELDNIKEKVEEIVAKIKGNSDLMNKFKKDPEAAVKEASKVELPKGVLDKVVSGVKAALASDKLDGVKNKAEEALGDVGGKLKGLFGKKE